MFHRPLVLPYRSEGSLHDRPSSLRCCCISAQRPAATSDECLPSRLYLIPYIRLVSHTSILCCCQPVLGALSSGCFSTIPRSGGRARDSSPMGCCPTAPLLSSVSRASTWDHHSRDLACRHRSGGELLFVFLSGEMKKFEPLFDLRLDFASSICISLLRMADIDKGFTRCRTHAPQKNSRSPGPFAEGLR